MPFPLPRNGRLSHAWLSVAMITCFVNSTKKLCRLYLNVVFLVSNRWVVCSWRFHLIIVQERQTMLSAAKATLDGRHSFIHDIPQPHHKGIHNGISKRRVFHLELGKSTIEDFSFLWSLGILYHLPLVDYSGERQEDPAHLNHAPVPGTITISGGEPRKSLL